MQNKLSELEYNVMMLLAAGMDARAITDYLNISKCALSFFFPAI